MNKNEFNKKYKVYLEEKDKIETLLDKYFDNYDLLNNEIKLMNEAISNIKIEWTITKNIIEKLKKEINYKENNE